MAVKKLLQKWLPDALSSLSKIRPLSQPGQRVYPPENMDHKSDFRIEIDKNRLSDTQVQGDKLDAKADANIIPLRLRANANAPKQEVRQLYAKKGQGHNLATGYIDLNEPDEKKRALDAAISLGYKKES